MRGQRILCFVLLCGLCAGGVGCTAMESTYTFLSDNFMDRPASTDRKDEDWVRKVGVEARGDRPRELDQDTWYNKLFKSEKHREIERSLGVDQGF